MFGAGLFGGVLGMQRTFILHALESKLERGKMADFLLLDRDIFADATPEQIRATKVRETYVAAARCGTENMIPDIGWTEAIESWPADHCVPSGVVPRGQPEK